MVKVWWTALLMMIAVIAAGFMTLGYSENLNGVEFRKIYSYEVNTVRINKVSDDYHKMLTFDRDEQMINQIIQHYNEAVLTDDVGIEMFPHIKMQIVLNSRQKIIVTYGNGTKAIVKYKGRNFNIDAPELKAYLLHLNN